MAVLLYERDLPERDDWGGSIAVDTETMGLNMQRDRLCLVQICTENGDVYLVRIAKGQNSAPRLAQLLTNPAVLKIFHYARFDLAALMRWLDIACTPVYCTKIASKLTRTFTDRHGLRELCRERLNVDLSKDQQTSDWGADVLSEAQNTYAARDVLYLHALKEHLDILLEREERSNLAAACFSFLPVRARLDLMGWKDPDVFSH